MILLFSTILDLQSSYCYFIQLSHYHQSRSLPWMIFMEGKNDKKGQFDLINSKMRGEFTKSSIFYWRLSIWRTVADNNSNNFNRIAQILFEFLRIRVRSILFLFRQPFVVSSFASLF